MAATFGGELQNIAAIATAVAKEARALQHPSALPALIAGDAGTVGRLRRMVTDLTNMALAAKSLLPKES